MTPIISPDRLSKFIAQLDRAFGANSSGDQELFSADLSTDCFHPVNRCSGSKEFFDRVILPIQSAFGSLRRKVDIAMEGEWSPSGQTPQRWISLMGHYVGQHRESLYGIPPTQRLGSVRFGEFYRVEGDQVIAAKIIWDLPGLCAQVGRPVFTPSKGMEWLIPGPFSQDGVLRPHESRVQSNQSLRLVESMIAGLMDYDGVSLESMGMRRFWSSDMLWHGPWGIGSSSGLGGFQDVHQRPFLKAFPDRKGGNHSARFADGPYVCSTGWPSIRATHLGEYLGHPPTGRPITMRVMDWWRVENGLLSENWVFIDLPHLFLQLGRNLLPDFPEAFKL